MANTALGNKKVNRQRNKLKGVFLGRGDYCCLAYVFLVLVLFSVCSIFCATSFGDFCDCIRPQHQETINT